MIKNFVLETANAPGTSTTFNLGGAATDRLSFAGAGFTNGALCFYFMDDGAQFEWGIATFNTGSPNTLSRTTVLGNSAGTTARLNFTGTTDVYCEVPAEKMVYRNDSGVVDIGAPGNITASSKTLFRGHLNGLVLSNNAGTPNTKIDISAGAAMDEISQAGFITSSGTLTIDAGTTGANGLDTGSLANSSNYHVFIIGKTDGTAAGFLSTSLTPTLPTGYTLRRRIGTLTTDGSAHLLQFIQNGDDFIVKVPVLIVNVSNLSTTPTLYVVAPSGIKLYVRLRITFSNASGYIALLSSPDETSGAANSPGGNYTANAGAGVASVQTIDVWTDTSGQARAVSTVASTTFAAVLIGWRDLRGKLA